MRTRLLAVAAVLGATLAVATATGAAGAISRCTTAGLVVWLNTNGGAAAGSRFYTLELTNLSGGRCALRGYPGVSAVDLAGRRVGSAATRNPQTPVRTLVLASGSTASAQLQVNSTGVFPPGACRPVRAAGLRVYPPGATASKVVPFPFDACSRAGRAYLHVQSVRLSA
jgi:hypothetical protein